MNLVDESIAMHGSEMYPQERIALVRAAKADINAGHDVTWRNVEAWKRSRGGDAVMNSPARRRRWFREADLLLRQFSIEMEMPRIKS